MEALERLQKFDWLIQKLHTLRSSLQTEQGIHELQKLHALQMLQRKGAELAEFRHDDDRLEKMEFSDSMAPMEEKK